jgi:hypothetical protein
VQQLDRLGRHPAAEQDLHDRGRRGGRLRRGLDDRRVPGGEGGGQLVRQQICRGVERGDRQGDADRGAVGERGVAHPAGPAGHGQHLAADLPGLGGRNGERVGHPVDLTAPVLDRLAELQRQQPGQAVLLRQHLHRGALEHRRTGCR